MPFENFYAESDKAARRWWKAIGLAFLLIIAYWGIALSSMTKTDPEEIHPQTSTASERLRNVDALCTNLPKPEQFFFSWRDEPTYYSYGTAVSYHFKSDRDIEEIMPAFIVWFGANGWEPDPEIEHSFKKGAQTITIRTSSIYYAGNYEIYCYEAETVPKPEVKTGSAD